LFQDACETSCGHGFCEFCLNKCLEQKAGLCPVCQKNPSPIHPSYTLRAIVDSIKKSTEGNPCVLADVGSVESEKTAGDTCHNQKKYAEAIKHYTQALQKSPSADVRNAVLYNNRAQCYIKLEQYRRALDDCEEAIRLDANNIKAFIRKGDCLAKIGEYEPSRQAYLQATRLDSSSTWREHINKALSLLPPASLGSIPTHPPCPLHPSVPPHVHPPPVSHHPFPPQQTPTQQGRAYPNIRPHYTPQYPGYAHYSQNTATNNNNNTNNNSHSHSQDRRRAHDADGCVVQ
jgi:tetratricopeptide (TPR) repeat protein